jgi:hypothetical protein
MTAIHHRYLPVAGRRRFYRESGPTDAPAIECHLRCPHPDSVDQHEDHSYQRQK